MSWNSYVPTSSPFRRSHRTRRTGFTLVELLVVIGIIALLISILLPSLGRAREHSMRVKCAAQMQQLISAWTMYATENKGRIVPGGTDANSWVGNSNTAQAVMDGLLYKHLNTIQVYRCPSDPVQERFWTYSINNYICGSAGYRETDKWRVLKIAQIRRSSDTAVFLEENDPRGYNQGGFYEDYPETVNPGGWIDFPAVWHQNGANLAFADGHVAYWRWDDPRTPKMKALFESHPGSMDLDNLRKAMVTWPQIK